MYQVSASTASEYVGYATIQACLHQDGASFFEIAFAILSYSGLAAAATTLIAESISTRASYAEENAVQKPRNASAISPHKTVAVRSLTGVGVALTVNRTVDVITKYSCHRSNHESDRFAASSSRLLNDNISPIQQRLIEPTVALSPLQNVTQSRLEALGLANPDTLDDGCVWPACPTMKASDATYGSLTTRKPTSTFVAPVCRYGQYP